MQLYTLTEIEQNKQDLPYLLEVMEWVKSFLAKHHRNLGRPGPVCPFIPHALKSKSIKMAIIRGNNSDFQQLEEIVKCYREIFLQEKIGEKELDVYKAFLLIFPDVHINENFQLIDSLQQKLKLLFVESGLMLGEFHKTTQSPGLHNPDFRPLRSPIPLLVIRFMVDADLPFLHNPDVDPCLRIRYLEAYLKRFAHTSTEQIKLDTAYQALALAKEQIQETMVPQ